MTSSKSNQPVETIRDGALKATIWENPTEDGQTRHSIQIVRSYTDSAGNWHETSRYSRSELLRVSRLADRAYDLIAELRLTATFQAQGNA